MGREFSARAAIVGICLAFGSAGAALASPYTVYFDYTTTRFTDSVSGEVPGNVGVTYSGWLTFDLDNGVPVEVVTSTVQYLRQYAEAGCSVVRNGVCATGHGTAPPVVTAYSIATPLGTFGRWTGGTVAPYDYSERENLDGLSVKPAANYWIATSRQSQEENTGTLTSPGLDYIGQYSERFLQLIPFTTPADAAAPFTAYDQLAEAPTILPAGQSNLVFKDIGYASRYTEAGTTPLGPRPGSFEMQASLVGARLVAGEAQVPLPGTVVLLAIGLPGLVALRRRPH